MHRKNIIKKFLLLLLLTALSLTALTACFGDNDEPEDSDKIALIKGGKAGFKVVYSSAAGASIRRSAIDFVKELSDLGVDIGDAVSDGDATEVTDCELILGAGVRNRTEDCAVSAEELGPEGYVIKAVGKRIVIAGGSAEATLGALEIFKERQLGITEDTESLSNVSVRGDLLDEKIVPVTVTVPNINGTPLEEFRIVTDYGTEQRIKELCPSPAKLAQAIKSAVDTELEVSDGKATADGHEIIIRLADEAGDKGFRAYANGKDFIIECAYYNLFEKAFDAFVASEISTNDGILVFDKDYLFEYEVSTVKYSDFGAKGDGKTNDYAAILKTHEFANQCRQKVLADKGASYYIGLTGGNPIRIYTDVDWGDATFIIDDTAPGVFAERTQPIFYIKREKENEQFTFTVDEIKQLAGTQNPQVLRTYDQSGKLISGKIPWLAPRLTSDAMIIIKNENHKDYIRFGANNDKGQVRAEIVLVDRYGNIDPTTPISFDYEEITNLSIIHTDDAPVTVEGGRFVSICCRAGAETDYKNTYDSFFRGILIERSNTTVKNIDHKMKNEPKRLVGGVDNLNQSYPYVGFIKHLKTVNSKIISCDLTGHKVYYQDKSGATGASGVAMGTYDLVVQYSINSYLEGITQSAVPIHDNAYWGMMVSNFSRNMTFKSCKMSRFDAHCGFWNADLIDCEFGLCINVIGGGTLNIIGTKRYAGDEFISLRGDYGATFEGDMLIKDCTYYATAEYNTEKGGTYDQNARLAKAYVIGSGVTNGSYGVGTKYEASYYTWDFGYKCYMPQVITVDNLTSYAQSLAVFNDIDDKHFIKQSADDGIYEPTKKIIFKNMTDAEIAAIPNCFNPSTYTRVASITRETVK